MSWDAWLTDDRGHSEGDWNYTHNCNGMANAVLYADYDTTQTTWNEVFHADPNRPSWWRVLNGMSGLDGAMFLTNIIKGLEAEPERFRAMNPDNGWGNYDDFLRLLTQMRDAVPENWPSVWGSSG